MGDVEAEPVHAMRRSCLCRGQPYRKKQEDNAEKEQQQNASSQSAKYSSQIARLSCQGVSTYPKTANAMRLVQHA